MRTFAVPYKMALVVLEPPSAVSCKGLVRLKLGKVDMRVEVEECLTGGVRCLDSRQCLELLRFSTSVARQLMGPLLVVDDS